MIRFPVRPAPVKRPIAYFYHPESDCVFTTDTREAENAALEQGCDSLTRVEYETLAVHIEIGTPISQRRPIMAGGFGR